MAKIASLTLKQRIVLIFSLVSLVPFLLTVVASYAAITAIQSNQIQGQIRTNLREVQWNLENSLENLNHVSQQLVLEGNIGSLVSQYLEASNTFERAVLKDKIRSEISLVTYTNPNVGLLMYLFDGGKRYDFENSPVVRAFDQTKVPLLGKHYQISYFGPHKSLALYQDGLVLSSLRVMVSPFHEQVEVYLETGFKLTERILKTGNSGPQAQYLFLDANRRPVYSEVDTGFSSERSVPLPPKGKSVQNGYIWNEAVSQQGWTLVSLVKEQDFNLERDRWLWAVLVIFLAFALITIVLGTLLWRMVYRPLGVFQTEMSWIEDRDSRLETVPLNIPEFDRLLLQFQDMKGRIVQLMDEIKERERARADLEIEKLVYQINPHFLLNALNTVHWLAMVHQQPEIDRFTTSLTKLLSYNLGKRGRLGTIREEIEALQDYVTIQSMRYDLKFVCQIEVPDSRLDLPIPRFTLQPLVENAIYHGLGDDGAIVLRLEERDGLSLTVEDSGPGFSEKARDQGSALGMGIGLTYVEKVLAFHFEGKSRMEITTGKTGTQVRIILPLPKEVVVW